MLLQQADADAIRGAGFDDADLYSDDEAAAPPSRAPARSKRQIKGPNAGGQDAAGKQAKKSRK